MAIKIKFKKTSNSAKLPSAAYGHPAGIDIYADEAVRVPGRGAKAIKTGLMAEIRKDYYIEIKEKSGFSLRTPLSVKAGIIDPDYQGEIMVILQNVSEVFYDVDKGEAIAQLVVRRRYDVTVEEVDELSSPSTERGDKGFGSSDSDS